MRRLASLSAFLCLVVPQTVFAQEGLTRLLEAELSRFPAKVGIYVKHLESGEEAGVLADEEFDSHSVIKLPVLLLAFQMAEAGELDLDDRYEITRADLEPGSGIFQHHDLGATPTLRDLLTEMIITSDNTATGIMVRMVGGVDRLNTWIRRNGFMGVTVGPVDEGWRPTLELIHPQFGTITVEEAHGLMYGAWDQHQFALYESLFVGEKADWLERVTDVALDSAFAAYDRRPDLWYGVMTPRGAAGMVEAIASTGIVSRESSDRIQVIMRQQLAGARGIPHFLDLSVAHKTGGGPSGGANDVGIVYARSGMIVISFFSTGIEEPYGEFEDRIGRIAKLIVNYFDGLG